MCILAKFHSFVHFYHRVQVTTGLGMDAGSPCEGLLANFFNSLLHKKAGVQRDSGE